jgi:hypothetical protein
MRRTPGVNQCSRPSDLGDGRLHAMTTMVPENGSDVKAELRIGVKRGTGTTTVRRGLDLQRKAKCRKN